MSETSVVDAFDALIRPDPGVGERFAVQQLGESQCQLGKSATGDPALLISVPTAPARDRPAPIVLEHVRVQYDVDCVVRRPSGAEATERFTVISCTNADRALQHYFLRCVSSVVLTLGVAPSRDEVGGVIEALVELFKSLGQPGRKSIQGLWGELFVIAQAADITALVRAWHAAPEDRYDFASGADRIEVKTASGNIRSHFFSLDQLRPAAGVHVVVASLMVEPSAGGTSILDLFEEVRARVASDATLVLHMERVLRLSLGSGWRQGVEDSFDRQLATQSLRIYEAAVVPAPLQPLPPEVSELRFRVNLSNVAPSSWATVPGQSELFQAAMAS